MERPELKVWPRATGANRITALISMLAIIFVAGVITTASAAAQSLNTVSDPKPATPPPLLVHRPQKISRPGIATLGGLHLAASHGQLRALVKLLQQGAPINQTDAQGNTPLLLAVAARQEKILHKLLLAGARTDRVNQAGESALLIAVRRGYTSIVTKLVEAGALRKAGKSHQVLIEREAVRHCRSQIIREIFTDRAFAPRHPNHSNPNFGSDLSIAAGHCPAALLVDLLALSDTNSGISTEKNSVIAAVRNGNAPSLKLLLGQGFAADIPDKIGMTPLSLSASRGRTDMAKLLLDKTADINHTTISGNTPLMLAAHFGAPDMVQLLIERGANLNWRNQNGLSALMIGVRAGHIETVQLLLRAGANRALRNSRRQTALDIARASRGRSRRTSMLIKLMQ